MFGKPTPCIHFQFSLHSLDYRNVTEGLGPSLTFSALFFGELVSTPSFPKVRAGFLNFGPRSRLSTKPEAVKCEFDYDQKIKK